MAPTTNGPSPSQDPLINATVETTTIAVNSKLDSLINAMSLPSTGNTNIDRTLEGIRSELELLTTTQSNEKDQIKKLLDEALSTDVLAHLTKEIEAQINDCIETTVAGLVDEELNKYIPKDLRERVDKQRMDMQHLHVQIHNTEAKRSNSFIKTPKQFGENLHHIINEKGAKSELFPKTVKNLLELDDAKVIELVKFYGMNDVDMKSKTPNLNWFLREIGVAYQPNFFG